MAKNTKTTKTLRLTFLDTNNKKNSLTIMNAKSDMEEAEVRSAMTKIASANVFEKEGVGLYHAAQSAAYVERTVSDIFDDSAADKN